MTKKTLEKVNAQELYLHYFDVKKVKNHTPWSEGIYPVATIREIDPYFKQYDIIPVIFLTNNIFKEEELELKKLSKQITDLINQISQHHLGKKLTKIQLDCDWTQSTRSSYFKLIELIQEAGFEVSVTIRLHQVKFPKKTGIPPVKKGALMVYNVGKLDDFEKNSILSSDIVAQYVNKQTTYPLDLDIALPLFSQLVVRNNKGKIRLINGQHQETLQTTDTHFKSTGANTFEVLQDTLFHGLYLYKGYTIKTEFLEATEVVKAHEIIKNSSLKLGQTIFYHLDDAVLEESDFDKLIQSLSYE